MSDGPSPNLRNLEAGHRRMRRMRRLRTVPRWVVVPTIQKQTVDAHSFHVAWIYVWLCRRVRYQFTADDLVSVLEHDNDEARTGDTPSPAKTLKEGVFTLHECLLKVADNLEAALFLFEERAMGNMTVSSVRSSVYERGEIWMERAAAAVYREPQHRGCKVGQSFDYLVQHLTAICDPSVHPALETFP